MNCRIYVVTLDLKKIKCPVVTQHQMVLTIGT